MSDRTAFDLVEELIRHGRECEWIEFKVNNADPEAIGEYASALANGAALAGKAHGYLVWGVADDTLLLVGTTFSPYDRIKGNQSIDNWLSTQLTPQAHFRFFAGEGGGRSVVVLEVDAAETAPVRFKGTAHVRVGPTKKRLTEHPAIERRLWQTLQAGPPEQAGEAVGLSDAEVLDSLDVDGYYRLLGVRRPTTDVEILATLSTEQMIRPDDRGRWEITRFGALALARDLQGFKRMERKALRIIEYADNTRLRGTREHVESRGYAVAFEDLLTYLDERLPRQEQLGAIRRTVQTYPSLAVRELVANALVHQDLSVVGAGPTVEIFTDRVEVTNPGVPLVDTDRFLDTPPRSRNERLAAYMRRIGICEERGSGIDKVVFETEVAQLPAPEFQVRGDNTIATLLGPRSLGDMGRADRVRAVYLHTCLRHVNREDVTNASIRDRFHLTDSVKASRLLREALDDGKIRVADDGAGFKHRRYAPYWA